MLNSTLSFMTWCMGTGRSLFIHWAPPNCLRLCLASRGTSSEFRPSVSQFCVVSFGPQTSHEYTAVLDNRSHLLPFTPFRVTRSPSFFCFLSNGYVVIFHSANSCIVIITIYRMLYCHFCHSSIGYIVTCHFSSAYIAISAVCKEVKKVKCTLVQALGLCTGRTAHRGSRGISLITALEGVRGQCHAPSALYPRERRGIHCTGGWVSTRAGLDRCGKSRPHWDSIPGPSSP